MIAAEYSKLRTQDMSGTDKAKVDHHTLLPIIILLLNLLSQIK